MENIYRFLCVSCQYLWKSNTYKSSAYRAGYSCPKCGKKDIAGEEIKNDFYSSFHTIILFLSLSSHKKLNNPRGTPPK